MISIGSLVNIFTTYVNNSIDYIDQPLQTDKIIKELNGMFPYATCVDVIFTKNTDKLFFGIYVSPTVLPETAMEILVGDKKVELDRYKVEIDSKLFDVGLEPTEIVAYLLYEVSAMIENESPVEEVRRCIDCLMSDKDDVVDISKSTTNIQILTFGIKDALHKLTSIMYKDIDGVLSNVVVNELNLRDALVSGQNKVRSSVFGIGSEVREPDLMPLQWVFFVYKDVRTNANHAIDTLEQSKLGTASVLQMEEIDKTITNLRKVEYDVTAETAKFFNEKGGLMANLKRSGLRSIEDDLYEFSMRAKNAETEEEAYYALRQINSRLAILEEYIYTNDLSDAEREKWLAIAKQYRKIRDDLSQKKIAHQKNYGLFFDYDKLDELD